MSIEQVGPFAKAGVFAENFVQMLIFNSSVFELMEWMDEVEAGLNDPTLPREVKEQVLVDYNEIKRRFSAISGSLACG